MNIKSVLPCEVEVTPDLVKPLKPIDCNQLFLHLSTTVSKWFCNKTQTLKDN